MIEAIAPRRSPSRSKSSSASLQQARAPRTTSGAIGSSGRMSSSTSPAATRCTIGRCAPTATCSTNHARIRAEQDDADLSERRGERRRRRRAARASSTARAERLLGAVEVDLAAGGVKASPSGRAQEVLAQLHARGELGLAVAPLGARARRTSRASSAARSYSSAMRSAAARRSRTSSSRCELPSASASAASSARPSRRSLGRRSMSRARSRASSRSSRSCGEAADGSATSTTRRTSSGAFAASAFAARLDREPDADGRVARGLRVVGEQRQARRRRVRPTAAASTIAAWIARRRRGVSARGREVADLLVLEAVVGGRGLVVLGEQPGGDGRRERAGERVGVRRRSSSTRASTSRRSSRLNRRPRMAASASSAFVSSGRCAARREISVRTADGTSRSALRASRHTPSICWIMPPSR